MKITIVATGVPLPVVKYGGTERVIWDLGKELAAKGHKVTYIAAPGSRCSFAEVVIRNPQLPLNEQIPAGTDVVHFQNDVEPDVAFPHIVTIHGNVTDPAHKFDSNSVFVSSNHALGHGSDVFVYNGLDWSNYERVGLSKSRNHYHFLANAAWRVKNLRGAVQVVDQIPKAKLEVMGGNRLNFKMGFRFTLSPKAHFNGMVGGAQKLEILGSSRGLIFPVIWDEPFGLAVIESLYMGAPVFATHHGSLPELVIPEVGQCCSSVVEMAEAAREWQSYSPMKCRIYAQERFSSRRMADDYERLYDRVLAGEPLNLNALHPATKDLYPFPRI